MLCVFSLQKSKDKNVSWEETRRRTEASLARKRNNPPGITASESGEQNSTSPSSSGAMDTLLEKLRAAAPQARDQRDRRRRARLKDRHQVRVASGQKMPELALSQTESNEDTNSAADKESTENTLNPEPQSEDTPSGQEPQVSEGEDVADRAASMLQGLRADKDSEPDRVRRRESAEETRRNRRLRRRTPATNGSRDGVEVTRLSSVAEADTPTKDAKEEKEEKEEQSSPLTSPSVDESMGSPTPSSTPAIVVSSSPEEAK